VPLVAGIDSSTQSTKVEIRDADTGQLWGSGQRPHPATTPPRSEQDPGSWWSALVQAWHDAGRYNVAAISVAGQQHGLVALGEDNRPLRPAKLWNDTESAHDARVLVDALGAAGWARACGSVPVAAFTVTKLAWLARVEPAVFSQLRTVLLPHDWLTYRLTGRFVTDRGDASGTGYWSPPEGRWRTDLLRLIDAGVDWSDCLPLVLAPNEIAGPLEVQAARPLGLDGRDVVVGPGTGDNMAAALGLGLDAGDAVISVGTSGTVAAKADRPTRDATGLVAGFADATGTFLPLVCTLNATKVTDTMMRLLGIDHSAFDRLALGAPPGAGGVVCVPYFDGERTPNRPDATGMLAGLGSETTAGHLARAAVEGVVCGLLEGLDALRDAGVAVGGRLVLVGGGARSLAYRRVLADLSGRELSVMGGDLEMVAAGACVQAAAALLTANPSEVAASWGLRTAATTVEPDLSVDREAVRAGYARARDAQPTGITPPL